MRRCGWRASVSGPGARCPSVPGLHVRSAGEIEHDEGEAARQQQTFGAVQGVPGAGWADPEQSARRDTGCVERGGIECVGRIDPGHDLAGSGGRRGKRHRERRASRRERAGDLGQASARKAAAEQAVDGAETGREPGLALLLGELLGQPAAGAEGGVEAGEGGERCGRVTHGIIFALFSLSVNHPLPAVPPPSREPPRAPRNCQRQGWRSKSGQSF